MSTRQLVTVHHTRQCERCGTERTIETGQHQRFPNFTGWDTLETGVLFRRISSLGRGPYNLCPECAASFTALLVEWWKG